MKSKTIAIIGCGAAAVSFIRSFIQQCKSYQLNHVNLIIFEPASTLGVGLAYQSDLDNLVINRPAQTMSANLVQPGEFFEWMKRTNFILNDKKTTKKNYLIYPSRKIFGYYLSELIETVMSEAIQSNIHVKIIKDSVTQLGKDSPVYIQTKSSGIFFADYILLATGNNEPKDFYNLNNTPKYINSPYPLYKKLSAIGSNETVGILGNSLTAIDITLSLDYLRHNSNITMLSRLNVSPRVRAERIAPYQLQFLTTSRIQKKNDKITLRDILRLFRKELKQNGISWQQFFVEDNKNLSLSELISLEIEASKYDRKWQDILSATNEIIEDIWNTLDSQHKEIFTKYYQRIWLRNRSPIPPENARLLLELTKQKKLFSVSELDDVKYDHKIQKYIGITKKKQFLFDWVINATGPSRYVQPEDVLMHNLIQSGVARPHLFGGVDVDFNSSAIISDSNCINKNIRVLGHNTIGVYNYTSSLEMIAKKADKIAHDFAYLIKEDKLNGQDKVVNAPSFDYLSHFA